MSVKKEAAYHEAGHAVIAYKSKYHSIVSGLDIKNYGSGEMFIGLSKAKLNAAGKKPDESSATDRDVVKDLALVLTAGYVAEQLAAEKDNTLLPNRDCARDDHSYLVNALQDAGLSKKFDLAEGDVRLLLTADWPLVEKLADALFSKQSLDFDDVMALLGAGAS